MVMRGGQEKQSGMFSYVDVESRIPAGHPIRKIRKVVDQMSSAGIAEPVRTNWPRSVRSSTALRT